MANSPLLQIPQLAPNQSNKEVTINDGFSILERSLNDIRRIDMTDGDVSLNIIDYTRAFLFELTGHSVPRTLTIPDSTRLFGVFNEGASAVTIHSFESVGFSAVIPSGSFCVLFNNGEDVRIISDSAASGQVSAFLSLPDTPNSFEGQAGRALVVNSNEDGMVFGTISVNFTGLTDTPNTYATRRGQTLRVNQNQTGLEFAQYLDTFNKLSDTPADYIGHAGRMVTVNTSETGLVFEDIPEPVIMATRILDLPNGDFELNNFDNWLLPSTSGTTWQVGESYEFIGPADGNYLAYFERGQGTEPTAIGYEIDLTSQAYPEELDDIAELVVYVSMASMTEDLGNIEVEFYDESDDFISADESPQYAATVEMIERFYRLDIPAGARKAMVYLKAEKNPEVSDPEFEEDLTFAYDGLKAELKLTVDQINSFIQLFDVPLNYEGQSGKMVVVNGNESGLIFQDAPAIRNTLIDLLDTPATYSGMANRYLRVNVDATGITFATPSFLDSSNVPNSFSGHSGKVLRVNAGENQVIFSDYTLGSLTNVEMDPAPVEGNALVYDSLAQRWRPGEAGGSADYPPFDGNAGYVLTVNAGEDGVEWKPGGGGSAVYPNMANHAGHVLSVNAGEDGVQWADVVEVVKGSYEEAETSASLIQSAISTESTYNASFVNTPTEGNWIVAIVFWQTASPNTAAGWSVANNISTGSRIKSTVYYKRAVASESTAQSPISSGADFGYLVLFEIRCNHDDFMEDVAQIIVAETDATFVSPWIADPVTVDPKTLGVLAIVTREGGSTTLGLGSVWSTIEMKKAVTGNRDIIIGSLNSINGGSYTPRLIVSGGTITEAGYVFIAFKEHEDTVRMGGITLNDVTNVNAASPEQGQALVYDAETEEWVAGNSGLDYFGDYIQTDHTLIWDSIEPDTNFTWSTTAGAGVLLSDPEVESDYVLKMPAITHNQTTEGVMTFTAYDKGQPNFFIRYRVSSESNYDWFEVYIDDVRVVRVSGAGSWTEYSDTLPAGEHELKILYTKDGSTNREDDTAYISLVKVLGEEDIHYGKGVIVNHDGQKWFSLVDGATGIPGRSNQWEALSSGGALSELSDVEMVVEPVEGNALIYDSNTGKWVPGTGFGNISSEFDIALYVTGEPEPDNVLARYVASREFTLVAGLEDSYAYADVPPDSNVAFLIRKNGVTIGTLTFPYSENVGVFSFPNNVSFAAGDRFTFLSPLNTYNIADIAITIAGSRQ